MHPEWILIDPGFSQWHATCESLQLDFRPRPSSRSAIDTASNSTPHPMKTMKITLASFLIVASSASAAQINGSIKTGPLYDSTPDSHTPADIATWQPRGNAWGLQLPDSPRGLLMAELQRNKHSGHSLPVNRPQWPAFGQAKHSSSVETSAAWSKPKDVGISEVPLFRKNPPGAASDPALAAPIAISSLVITPHPVPDGGSSMALLGLSALGLASTRRILKKRL